MALKKARDLSSGVVAEYWRVMSVTIQMDGQPSSAFLGLYLSAAARVAGKDAIETATVSIELADKNDASLASVYEAIKATPGFIGSEDI